VWRFLRVLPWFLLVILLGRSVAAGDFSCTKPIAFPDRWEDVNKDGVFEPGIDSYDSAITGYTAPGDVGSEFTFHAESAGDPLVPGGFLVVDLPPLDRPIAPLSGTGATTQWFTECPPYGASNGDSLQPEVASTAFHEVTVGLNSLIASDPDATWDEATRSVQGSAFAETPRSIVVVGYDPLLSPQAGRPVLIVRKLVRVFVESTGANSTFTVRFQDVATELPTPVRAITWGRLKAHSTEW
jgi:hypothetical protein